jgi:RNA polymerase sigma factor (sigma-70 family)
VTHTHQVSPPLQLNYPIENLPGEHNEGSRLGEIFASLDALKLKYAKPAFNPSDPSEVHPCVCSDPRTDFRYKPTAPLSTDFLLTMDKIRVHLETKVRCAGYAGPLDFALNDFLNVFDGVQVGEGRIAVFNAVKIWYRTAYLKQLHRERMWRDLYEDETPLSRQQEAAFFENMRSSPDGGRWRDLFLHRNGGLVGQLVYSFLRQKDHVLFDEDLRDGERAVLLSAGRRGLEKAVDKFKPELGYKFSTHAWLWIKGELTALFRRKAAEERYFAKCAVDAVASSYGIFADQGPRVATDYLELNAAVEQALDRLNDPRKSQIIIARYGLFGHKEEPTLKVIAQSYGISAQRVHAILKTSLAKLKKDRELRWFYRRWLYW